MEDNNLVPGQSSGENKEGKNNRKPYVWLHPPRNLELTHHDELFVLCENNPKDNMAADGLQGERT